VLRRTTIDDAVQVFFLRSDESVLKYIDREKMESRGDAEALIAKIDENFEKSESIFWAISLKGNNEMIGQAGIWRIDKENHRGEVGYTLHPAYWNKKIMSEVLVKIIAFGFSELNLHSLEANVNPENKASIRLLEKLGFVREAYFRENYFFRGKFLDSVIYSLIAPKMEKEHSQ